MTKGKEIVDIMKIDKLDIILLTETHRCDPPLEATCLSSTIIDTRTAGIAIWTLKPDIKVINSVEINKGHALYVELEKNGNHCKILAVYRDISRGQQSLERCWQTILDSNYEIDLIMGDFNLSTD